MSLRDAELPADFGVDGDDTTALEAIAKAVCENTAETNRGNQDMSAEFWRLADQDSIINDGEILHTVLEGSPEKQTWDACEVEEDLCLNVRNGDDIEIWTQDEVAAFCNATAPVRCVPPGAAAAATPRRRTRRP